MNKKFVLFAGRLLIHTKLSKLTEDILLHIEDEEFPQNYLYILYRLQKLPKEVAEAALTLMLTNDEDNSSFYGWNHEAEELTDAFGVDEEFLKSGEKLNRVFVTSLKKSTTTEEAIEALRRFIKDVEGPLLLKALVLARFFAFTRDKYLEEALGK